MFSLKWNNKHRKNMLHIIFLLYVFERLLLKYISQCLKIYLYNPCNIVRTPTDQRPVKNNASGAPANVSNTDADRRLNGFR